MAGLVLPPCPPSLKPIQHLLKTGTEHEGRDPVVAYWCRLAALQAGLALDKSSKVKKKPVLNYQCCGSGMFIPDP
jgi:vacuolar protein sorting-associated protein VTA1